MPEEQYDPIQASAQQLYEQEDNMHKARLIESDYRKSLSELISKESLSARCKIAMISFINMAFDKNVILANNSSLESRKLAFEIALNKTKLSYSRPDAMNPILPSLHENIRNHFGDFVSRSYRMLERERQGQIKTVQNVEYNDKRGQNNQPKRGFGLNPFAKKSNDDEERQ